MISYLRDSTLTIFFCYQIEYFIFYNSKLSIFKTLATYSMLLWCSGIFCLVTVCAEFMEFTHFMSGVHHSSSYTACRVGYLFMNKQYRRTVCNTCVASPVAILAIS